jgi:hypothetical protein
MEYQLCNFVYSRETYWGNYATGLGASLHELGHTFDLAHTPTGIMARGFDDIHRVFTVQRSKSSRQSSDRSRETSSSRDSPPKIAASNNVGGSTTSSGGNLANQNSKKHSSGSSGEESPSIKVKSSFCPAKPPTGFSFKNPIKKVSILRYK